jgi:hypothetical protein
MPREAADEAALVCFSKEKRMKLAHLLSILALLTLGTIPAKADPPGKMDDFAGTYFASLPERAEILQLHEDGTAGMTLSDPPDTCQVIVRQVIVRRLQ